MAKKESAQIKSSNPFYELIKVYSAHQVIPGTVVGGVPITPGRSAENVNLSGAYLQGAFLAFSDFSGSNLADANLQAGSISFADFGDVRLKGASLSMTSFAKADLRRADLRRAQMVLMDNY